MRLRTLYPDKSVKLWWPIKLKWVRASLRDHLRFHLFTTHGFWVGWEACRMEETSRRAMYCRREVYGWTLHIGALKVIFGSVPEIKPDPVALAREVAKYPNQPIGRRDDGSFVLTRPADLN